MLKHEVAFLQNGDMSKFDMHVVDIDIRPDNMSPLTVKDNHFLLLKQDLLKFTRYLRIMEFSNSLSYHFKFNFRSTLFGQGLSLSKQTIILEPFKVLTGSKLIQTVTFTGRVDGTIAKDVVQAMTQKTQWIRAFLWELYDIATSIKAVGDELWEAGFRDAAAAKWDDVIAWIPHVQRNHATRLEIKADTACSRIRLICSMDRALWALSSRDPGKEKLQYVLELCQPIEFQDMAKQDPEVNSVFQRPLVHLERRFWYFCGIAELGLDCPNKSTVSFANAIRLNSQNAKYRAGHNAARCWANANEIQRKSSLQLLLDDLPEPFPLEDWNPYKTFEVRSGHYCLRKLGFKGKFPLEDKIKPRVAAVMALIPDHGPRVCTMGQVKYSKMEEYLESARQKMALLSNRICWINLGPEQLGEGIPLPEHHCPEDQGE